MATRTASTTTTARRAQTTKAQKALKSTPERSAKVAAAVKAPTTRSRKATPVAVDLVDLERSLKSAKGVLWTMNHRGATAEKIAAQEAKVAELKGQVDAVRPARGYDGPAWVVALDAATGKVTSTKAANASDARRLAAAARSADLVVNVVRAS